MNKSRLIILSVVVFLAAICVGGFVYAQTNQPNQPTGTDPIKPLIMPRNDSSSVGSGVNMPYPIPYYPYPVDGSLSQIITQLLTNTGDGTYTNFSLSTVAGVTTITADEIKVASTYFTAHLVNLKAVIENQPYRSSPAQLTITASLIEYKDSQTSFSGKDVSFSQPLYQYYPYAYGSESSGSGSSGGGLVPPVTK
jgi:hypothetical protein